MEIATGQLVVRVESEEGVASVTEQSRERSGSAIERHLSAMEVRETKYGNMLMA